MNVETIPLTDFVHGSINAHQGRAVLMDEYLAKELEQAGLIRIKMSPTHANKMMGEHENKSGNMEDDGAAPLSSASLAGQVLPTRTLHLSKPGNGKLPKTDT